MKMNNKTAVKITAIVMLLSLIVTFTHCGQQKANQIGDGEKFKSTYTTPAGAKTEGQILNETQVTTGVKNHEQILHTMGAVTGIEPFSNNNIMSVYRQVETSLPTDNDIKVFSSTQQLAITKLAAEFCFAATADQNLRSRIWPGFNFNATANTAFASSSLFINQTITVFWGPFLSDDEMQNAHDNLEGLIDALLDKNDSATTLKVARGVCTAALSSAYVTLL